MAVATGTALALGALGLQGAGMGYNAYQQNQAAKDQNAQQQALLQAAAGMRQYGPSGVEQMLLGLFNQQGQGRGSAWQPTNIDMSSIAGSGGFNMGQDALMQMLRAGPQSNLDKSLNSILSGGGNPFDTSKMFDALGMVDRRNTNQQVADLRGGAGGLGERFGSAMMGAETALRQNVSSDINSRNAQIQAGSHESAQARMLQAAAQLAGRDEFYAGLGSNIRQGGLDLGQLMLQANNSQNAAGAQARSMNQQDNAFGAQLLQMLLGAEQNRNAFNLSTLGLGAGMMPVQPGYGFGNAMSDFGQMMMFMQEMNRRRDGGY
jgi:hypothetical protein